MMSGRDPESFIIRRKPIVLPPDATRDDLFARRSRLVEAVLAKVPQEHRDELARLLSRDATDLLYSIGDEEIADMISEIYSIDAIL